MIRQTRFKQYPYSYRAERWVHGARQGFFWYMPAMPDKNIKNASTSLRRTGVHSSRPPQRSTECGRRLCSRPSIHPSTKVLPTIRTTVQLCKCNGGWTLKGFGRFMQYHKSRPLATRVRAIVQKTILKQFQKMFG